MSRFSAFGLHLGASFLVLGSFLGAVYFWWYPSHYLALEGGFKVMMTLMGVDVVLGPILTLILFKPGKPGLWFDVTTVLTLQIAAFVYGTWVVHSQRPLYVAFSIDTFYVSNAAKVDLSRLTDPGLRPGFFDGPKPIFVRRLRSMEERARVFTEMVNGQGGDLFTRPDFFQDYEQHREEVIASCEPLAALTQGRPDREQVVTSFLRDRGKSPEEVVYAPIQGSVEVMTALVDRQSAQILTILPINPW